jgi:hypothetical protein
MNKQEAIDYCYQHENEYKAKMYTCGENGQGQFDCLISILESDTILPNEIKDYGMNF